MSNYTPLVNYAAKDALTTGNPSKKILGTEISAELSAIATAITSKEDSANKGIANGYVGLDSNSIASAGGYLVTGSNLPANGFYLPASNTVGVSTNSTARASFGSTGLTLIGGSSVLSLPRASDGATVGTVGSRSGSNIGIYNSGGSTAEFILSGGAAELFTNSTQRLVCSSSGTFTINAPASGTALSVSGASAANVASFSSAAATDCQLAFTATGVRTWSQLVANSNGRLYWYDTTRAAEVLALSSSGNVTISAPSSGATLTANTISGGNALHGVGAGANIYVRLQNTTDANGYLGYEGTELSLWSANAKRVAINSAGNVTVNAPSSGAGLTVAGGGINVTGGAVVATGGLTVSAGGLTVSAGGAGITGTVTGTAFSGDGSSLTALNASNLGSGTVPSARVSGAYTGITSVAANATIDGVTIGWRSIPRSTTTTTAAVGDVGKCIAASAGITIPNSTFAAGDALSIYNDSASAITITQGSGLTLRLGGTTTTGNLTLQPRGMITVWFNTASEAIVTGAGVA